MPKNFAFFQKPLDKVFYKFDNSEINRQEIFPASFKKLGIVNGVLGQAMNNVVEFSEINVKKNKKNKNKQKQKYPPSRLLWWFDTAIPSNIWHASFQSHFFSQNVRITRALLPQTGK